MHNVRRFVEEYVGDIPIIFLKKIVEENDTLSLSIFFSMNILLKGESYSNNDINNNNK